VHLVESLPDVVPLFPLPNVVLFPQIDLPLHIFEPRYRAMVADAMAGDRLIGMTVLRGEWRRDYHGSPEVYPIGCVGRIEQFDLLSDGRSNLVLHGLRAFQIAQEVPSDPYRRARVAWRDEDPPRGSRSGALRERLEATISRLLSRGGGPSPADLWPRLPADTDHLINALAFSLDLSVVEKLALLECAAGIERGQRLVEIVEFKLAEFGLSAFGLPDDERRH
jgi:uncharacterized protein